jgi:transposase-like protein
MASGCAFVRAGRIVDFLLSKRRDVMSAKRFFSQRIRPTIGFKRFDMATVTIRRIELAETEKIKKYQFNLESLNREACYRSANVVQRCWQNKARKTIC